MKIVVALLGLYSPKIFACSMVGGEDFIELNIRYGFLFTGATIGFIGFTLFSLLLRGAAKVNITLNVLLVLGFLVFHPINFNESINEGDCGMGVKWGTFLYMALSLGAAVYESIKLRKYVKNITIQSA